jgi:RNA polymerase sigma factor (TIGR02999 family)
MKMAVAKGYFRIDISSSHLTNIPTRGIGKGIEWPMEEAPKAPVREPNVAAKTGGDLPELIYAELRRIAAAKMAQEAPGQTLQPTALVHEAWLRLGGDTQPAWENRAHFFAAAAEAMRRILIDRARRKGRVRHGGGHARLNLEDLDRLNLAIITPDDSLLALDEALCELEAEEPEAARVVNYRFFAGLSMGEIGQILGVNERTVKRTWAFARAWLYERLRPGPEAPS